MKALSLTQPWATLVAIGAKQIETRSWETLYRGPVAIHAAKAFPRWAKDLAGCSLFQSYLGPAGFELVKQLPLGAVVATGEIVGCKRILREQDVSWPGLSGMRPPAEPERSFGDYEPGRYAWILKGVKMLPEPIPAKGALGLWNWEPPLPVS